MVSHYSQPKNQIDQFLIIICLHFWHNRPMLFYRLNIKFNWNRIISAYVNWMKMISSISVTKLTSVHTPRGNQWCNFFPPLTFKRILRDTHFVCEDYRLFCYCSAMSKWNPYQYSSNHITKVCKSYEFVTTIV